MARSRGLGDVYKRQMEDGSTASFAGARKVNKFYEVNLETGTVQAIFEFRNGRKLSITSDALTKETVLTAVGHGLVQKIGDEWAGVQDVDDMVLEGEKIIKRLTGEGWSAAPSEKSDSMAGASVVIRAIIEDAASRGVVKTVEQIKAYLDGKIEAARAKGEKLSRQELYATFRHPSSRIAPIIKRLEEEKTSKTPKVSSEELLADLG
jgi:hypothetical protein